MDVAQEDMVEAELPHPARVKRHATGLSRCRRSIHPMDQEQLGRRARGHLQPRQAARVKLGAGVAEGPDDRSRDLVGQRRRVQPEQHVDGPTRGAVRRRREGTIVVAADQEHQATRPGQLPGDEGDRVAGDVLELEEVATDRHDVGLALQRQVNGSLEGAAQELAALLAVASLEAQALEGPVQVKVGEVQDPGYFSTPVEPSGLLRQAQPHARVLLQLLQDRAVVIPAVPRLDRRREGGAGYVG